MLLAQYTELLHFLLDSAEQHGAYLLARVQQVESRGVSVVNGKTESMAGASSLGLGLHVFDRAGHTAFATTDRLDRAPAERALRSALAGLEAASKAELVRNPAVFELTPTLATVVPPTPYALDDLPLQAIQADCEAINAEVRAYGINLKVSTSFSIDRELWRIVRSDGTDVQYLLPHGYAYNSITVQNGNTHTVGSSLSRTGYEVVREQRDILLQRAYKAATIAQDLMDAPRYPAGSYPLVLDYALAKGLAHEAFGHAVETDGLRTSILGNNGVLRRGEQLAAEIVSIIDEPLAGDHAYQPYSPNGILRGRATILDHGVLQDGLGDLFSAAAAGVPIVDAARAQSYGSVPVPRMTNIRIELPAPHPLSGSFESQTPETVRAALLNAGLLHGDEPVIFLSGYKGGQVNPATGDFVFNCAALYELRTDSIKIFQPSIFTGQSLAALQAIEAGFGPLQLDAMGFCGKAGQSVPSSGGSHYFLYLRAHPAVQIGGSI